MPGVDFLWGHLLWSGRSRSTTPRAITPRGEACANLLSQGTLLQALPLPEPGAGTDADDTASPRDGYVEFEPASPDLLVELVPRYVEAAVFGALLEAAASEHTARQRAMAAATDNAEELVKTLTREMNRARQDAITTEIMEIVGGAEALRQAARHE